MNIKQKIKEFLFHDTAFTFVLPAVLWQLIFLYIPLLIVIYVSFQVSSDAPWHILTLSHYRFLFQYDYFHIIGRSVAIAAIVAIICLLLAYPVAYFLALKV